MAIEKVKFATIPKEELIFENECATPVNIAALLSRVAWFIDQRIAGTAIDLRNTYQIKISSMDAFMYMHCLGRLDFDIEEIYDLRFNGYYLNIEDRDWGSGTFEIIEFNCCE